MRKVNTKPASQDAVQVAFGAAVRQLRLQRELTQESLAAAAGMHFTYVSSVERGERNISLQNIHRLADALEVTASALMRTAEHQQAL